jgi:hypothetical protein
VRKLLVCAFVGVLAGHAVAACRDPTQLAVDVTTNAECSDIGTTETTVGDLGGIESSPPAATKDGCDARGVIGSLVLSPTSSKDGAVAFKVVTGIRRPANRCTPPDYTGCIVARRALRYEPHTSLKVNVYMDLACEDVPCGETDTCVAGRCVPAQITDPGACALPGGCSEAALGDGGTTLADSGGAADARVDGGLDAGPNCPLGWAYCTPDGAAPYCASTTRDVDNCGGCGIACGPGKTCTASSCALSCQPYEAACTPDGGTPYCANLHTEVTNCGACGTTCGQGRTCEDGGCAITCQPYETLCQLDGGPPYCTNTNVDSANCGTCGHDCLLLHCTNGTCL